MESLAFLKNQLHFKTRTRKLILIFLALRLVYYFWPRKRVIGRTVLVTGAGRGIGRALALQLARKGARLILWDLNEENLQSVTEEVKKIQNQSDFRLMEPTVIYQKVDVCKKEEVYRLGKLAQDQMGFIYCIVNNAGIVSGLPFLELSDQQIIKTMEVNTMAHFWTCKTFLPDMIKHNQGHICTVASAAGVFGAPGMTDYSASKFAVVGFTESLRQELTKLGSSVRTSIICPAHVQTPLFEGYKPGLGQVSMTPEYVAYKIIQAIEQRKSFVMLPRSCYMGYFLKVILPTYFDDYYKKITKVTDSMDHWRAHQVK